MGPLNRERTQPQVPIAEAEKAGFAETLTLDSSHQMKREGTSVPPRKL